VFISLPAKRSSASRRTGYDDMGGSAGSSAPLLAVQTGLRLSEIINSTKTPSFLGRGAHVRLYRQRSKERCTPLTSHTQSVLRVVEGKANRWVRNLPQCSWRSFERGCRPVPSAQVLNVARTRCASLKQKRVSFMAAAQRGNGVVQAGVDCSVIALWLGTNR